MSFNSWGEDIFVRGFIASLLLILLVTLFPFDFIWNNLSWQEISNRFHNPSDFTDFINNIILFFPLGFSLAGLLQQRRLSGVKVILIVFAASTVFSCTIEFLQVFIPSRKPTILDIVTNSMGGLLGGLSCHLWKEKILNYLSYYLRVISRFLSIKYLTLGFLVYTSIIVLISINLPTIPTNFSNWNVNFPLLIGNEKTGNRSWNGYVSEVLIANRSIDREEVKLAFLNDNLIGFLEESLIAFYPLNNSENIQDKTNNFPNLVWQENPTNITENLGVFLDKNHWLSTVIPATVLTEKLTETSEFTISLKVATANLQQTGPARIVSLSEDAYERNFTLGQEKTDLIFRLRTPMTGENGTHPELLVRNVFTDKKIHHIIVTYAGSRVRFYIDRVGNFYSFYLAPEINFFQLIQLLDDSCNSVSMRSYKFLYYALIFVPLGTFLGLIIRQMRKRLFWKILLGCSGIILPCFLLEKLLTVHLGRSLDFTNILLGLVLMVGSLLVVCFNCRGERMRLDRVSET
ncbi:MAG: VanZ family protein [Lyngbya sp.]|nr:VanZ family protein [Lyngbya sp.]